MLTPNNITPFWSRAHLIFSNIGRSILFLQMAKITQPLMDVKEMASRSRDIMRRLCDFTHCTSFQSSFKLGAHFFNSQFWNENGWYRMQSQHSVHSAPGSRMNVLSISEYECGINERTHLTFWPFSFQNCE